MNHVHGRSAGACGHSILKPVDRSTPRCGNFGPEKTARNDPFRSMRGYFPMGFAFIVKHQKLLCPGGDTTLSLISVLILARTARGQGCFCKNRKSIFFSEKIGEAWIFFAPRPPGEKKTENRPGRPRLTRAENGALRSASVNSLRRRKAWKPPW